MTTTHIVATAFSGECSSHFTMDDLQKVAFYFLVTICSGAGLFGIASYLSANMVYSEDKEGKKDKKDKAMDVKVSHLMFQHFLHIFLQADFSVAIENAIPHEAVPLVTESLVRGGEEVGVRMEEEVVDLEPEQP